MLPIQETSDLITDTKPFEIAKPELQSPFHDQLISTHDSYSLLTTPDAKREATQNTISRAQAETPGASDPLEIFSEYTTPRHHSSKTRLSVKFDTLDHSDSRVHDSQRRSTRTSLEDTFLAIASTKPKGFFFFNRLIFLFKCGCLQRNPFFFFF